MIFSHVDGDVVYVTMKMKRCRECGEYMLNTMGENLSSVDVAQMINKGLRVCTDGADVCEPCKKTGNYKMRCGLCGQHKKFPSEFTYKATEYIMDCDPEPVIICNDCVANRPQEVIRILAAADAIDVL